MPGGIWEAIGAALQQGGQTYQNVRQQNLLNQREAAEMQMRRDAAAREAHYQDVQLGRQQQDDADKDADRKRKILVDAISAASPDTDLTSLVPQIQKDAPELMPLFVQAQGTLASRDIGGLLRPGGVTQHLPDGESVTEGNGPVGSDLKMGPLMAAGSARYSIKGTPQQRIQNAQANMLENLLTNGGLPTSAGPSGTSGTSPSGLKDTPQNRIALDLLPGVSANSVLGPAQNNPFAGTVTGPDVLKGLSPQEALLVQKMANYELPIPGGNMRSPQMQRLLGLAASYDPSFDATQYGTRQALRKDFTSGKSAQNIRSLNTLVSHLAELNQKAGALNNFDSPALNAPVNWFESSVMGDPRVTGFNSASHAVESEAAALFKGMGASDQEIKAWRSTLGPNMGPEQLQESMKTMGDLLMGRMNALQSQYEKGMGKPANFELLNPQSKKILEKFGIGTGAPEGQPNLAPEGEPTINVASNPMGGEGATSSKVASASQVNAYARARRISPKQAASQLVAEGWKISGQ